MVLTSTSGIGWIANADTAGSYASCCNPPSGTMTCCPSLTIKDATCQGSTLVTATQTIWGEWMGLTAGGGEWMGLTDSWRG